MTNKLFDGYQPISYANYQKYWKIANYTDTEAYIKHWADLYLKPQNIVMGQRYFSVYINVQTQKIYPLGGDFKHFLGASQAEIFKEGYITGEQSTHFVHPEDNEIALGLFLKATDFISSMPANERKYFKINTFLRFVTKDKRTLYVLEQDTFIANDQYGNLKDNILFVTDISHLRKDNEVMMSILDVRNEDHQTFIYHQVPSTRSSQKPIITFTARERQIVTCICHGMTSIEIGVHLGISHHTVNTFRKNLCAKTNTHNTAELVNYAIKNALL